MVTGWNRHLPSPLRVLLDDFELTSRAAPRARVALPISSDPVVGLSSLSPASCRVRPKRSFGTALQFLAATGSAPNARSRRGIRGRARRPATSLPSPEPVPSPLSSFDPFRGFAAGGKNGPPAQSARSNATPAAPFYCSVTLPWTGICEFIVSPRPRSVFSYVFARPAHFCSFVSLTVRTFTLLA